MPHGGHVPCLGQLRWLALAKPVWGFLADRIDHRIAVSEQSRETATRHHGGEYELIPNGVLIPEQAEPGGREHRIVFACGTSPEGLAGAAARVA